MLNRPGLLYCTELIQNISSIVAISAGQWYSSGLSYLGLLFAARSFRVAPKIYGAWALPWIKGLLEGALICQCCVCRPSLGSLHAKGTPSQPSFHWECSRHSFALTQQSEKPGRPCEVLVNFLLGCVRAKLRAWAFSWYQLGISVPLATSEKTNSYLGFNSL